MSCLQGICPKCKARYCGWALKSPWYQICDRCGSELEIKDWQAEGLAKLPTDYQNKTVTRRAITGTMISIADSLENSKRRLPDQGNRTKR